MADINQIITHMKGVVSEATANVLAIYAEKGFEPFKKPLMVAVPLLLVFYMVVYRPMDGKITDAAYRLESSKVISSEAGDYNDVKLRLYSFQSKLPRYKDKDDWLNYVLTNTAKTNGVSIDLLGAQTENEEGGFVIASRKVELTLDYNTLGKWLADIENSSIFLRIVSLNAVKIPGTQGMLKVSLQLSTVFVKPGAAEGAQ